MPKSVRQPLLYLAIILVFSAPGTVLAIQQAVRQTPPPPLTYTNNPFPVGQPKDDVPPDPSVRQQLHAGDIPTLFPERCVTDDAGTGLGELPYTFTMALYNASTRTRLADLPGGFASAPVGCQTIPSRLRTIPDDTRPGAYYLAGTATATGSSRSATVGWQTVPFEVIPDD